MFPCWRGDDNGSNGSAECDNANASDFFFGFEPYVWLNVPRRDGVYNSVCDMATFLNYVSQHEKHHNFQNICLPKMVVSGCPEASANFSQNCSTDADQNLTGRTWMTVSGIRCLYLKCVWSCDHVGGTFHAFFQWDNLLLGPAGMWTGWQTVWFFPLGFVLTRLSWRLAKRQGMLMAVG